MMMLTYSLTRHAHRRARQRGIRPEILDLLLIAADREMEAGDGCVACSFSRRGLRRLAREGVRADELERVAGLVAIIAADARIVTVYRRFGAGHGGRTRQAECRPRHWGWPPETPVESGVETAAGHRAGRHH